MKKFRGLFTTLLALSLLLVACGGGQTTTPTTAARPEPKAEATPNVPKEVLTLKLGLGNMDSVIYLPIKYALNAKLFEKQGLQVEPVQLKGGAQVTQSLVDGQADVAFGAMEHVLKYKQQGVDLMLIATLTEQPGAVLVVDAKYKDSIKSFKDLKGKKVGITSIGSGSDTIRLLMMEKAGLTTQDIEAVGIGFDVPTAFAEGKVVAAIAYAPYGEELLSSGKAYALPDKFTDLRTPAGVTELYGHDAMPMVSMMIHKSMATKNPELAQRVVKAIIQAEREIAAGSPEEIAKVVPAPTGISDKAYLDSLTRAKVWLSQTGNVRAETVQAVTGALKRIKAMPDSAVIDPAAVLDNTFASKS